MEFLICGSDLQLQSAVTVLTMMDISERILNYLWSITTFGTVQNRVLTSHIHVSGFMHFIIIYIHSKLTTLVSKAQDPMNSSKCKQKYF